MSHFGRSGPPDINNTYSLLILNITFRTSADDLFPLFDRYGKVVDIFIPRDRRTGEVRGFAFVRYKHMDEAQKAMEKLDGVNVNGRDIVVQLAKYGRSMEKLQRGQIAYGNSNWNNRSDSQSPRRTRRYGNDYYGRRYGNDYYDRESRRNDYGYGRFERNRYRETSRDFPRSGPARGRSRSPNRGRSHSHSRSPSPSRGHRRARDYSHERYEGGSFEKNVSQQVSRGSLSPRRLSSPDRAMSPGSSRPQRKYLSPAQRSSSEARSDSSPAEQNARLPASRSRSLTPIDQRPATASPEDEYVD